MKTSWIIRNANNAADCNFYTMPCQTRFARADSPRFITETAIYAGVSPTMIEVGG